METDPVDAQSALDTAAAAERRSAEIATPPLWYDLWFTHVRFVLLLITLVVLLVGAAAASTQLAWSYGLGRRLVPVAVVTAVLATLLSRIGNAMYAHVLGAR